MVNLKQKQGFTLLEILVALAVMGLVVVVLAKNSSTTVANAGYLKEKTLAHWVAMNKAAELHLSRTWLALGEKSGEEVMAGRQWQWMVTVHETPDPEVRRAVIDVTGGEVWGSPLTSISVFVGRP